MYTKILYDTLNKISQLDNSTNILSNIFNFYLEKEDNISINLLTSQLEETFKIDGHILIHYIANNIQINENIFDDFEELLNFLNTLKSQYSIFFKEWIIRNKDPFRITKFDCTIEQGSDFSNVTLARNDNVYLKGIAKIEDLLNIGTNLILAAELMIKDKNFTEIEKLTLNQNIEKIESTLNRIKG